MFVINTNVFANIGVFKCFWCFNKTLFFTVNVLYLDVQTNEIHKDYQWESVIIICTQITAGWKN